MKKQKPDKILLTFQKNEITEYYIYKYLSKLSSGNNRKVLKKISDDELKHYNCWKEYTSKDVSPDYWKRFKFIIIARIFSLVFAIKLFEKGEKNAQISYSKILSRYKKAQSILKDEEKHEKALINMIEEEKLTYIGSMVLGINDALVELTGTLAGLTFALQNSKVIGLAGIITGIAAALSMGASEYLSQKSEKGGNSPLKAALYTSLIYILTVICLVLPYFLFSKYFIALIITILIGQIIVCFFTYFISVVKEENFIKLFREMALLSLSVAVISFLIGILAKKILNINI